MKTLSVILITWNSEAYAKACLDSLLDAIADVDYEIIMVDNGSTDRTLNILDSYLSEHIRLYRNPKNYGVAKARNPSSKIGICAGVAPFWGAKTAAAPSGP